MSENFRIVSAYPFNVSERFNPECEMSLTKDYKGTKEQESYKLFNVILTRKIIGNSPVVSSYNILAPSEEEAIAQVETRAFPEIKRCILDEVEKLSLTATAIRIPFYIRGWGGHTF